MPAFDFRDDVITYVTHNAACCRQLVCSRVVAWLLLRNIFWSLTTLLSSRTEAKLVRPPGLEQFTRL